MKRTIEVDVEAIRKQCAALLPHSETPGGQYRLPGSKDHIAGVWHEDGGTFYIRCPEQLRPALFSMLTNFPALLNHIAKLEEALKQSHEISSMLSNEVGRFQGLLIEDMFKDTQRLLYEDIQT